MIDGQQVSVYIVSAELFCSDTFVIYNDFPCSGEFCSIFVTLCFICGCWPYEVIIFDAMDGKLLTVSTHKIIKFENPQSLAFYFTNTTCWPPNVFEETTVKTNLQSSPDHETCTDMKCGQLVRFL